MVHGCVTPHCVTVSPRLLVRVAHYNLRPLYALTQMVCFACACVMRLTAGAVVRTVPVAGARSHRAAPCVHTARRCLEFARHVTMLSSRPTGCGLVFYFVLTGKHPFPTSSFTELLGVYRRGETIAAHSEYSKGACMTVALVLIVLGRACRGGAPVLRVRG